MSVSKDEQRVVRCFASVFPKLPEDRIPSAKVDNVKEWDSLAMVTLVAVLEQEFGAEIDMLDLPDLASFEGVLRYLCNRGLATSEAP